MTLPHTVVSCGGTCPACWWPSFRAYTIPQGHSLPGTIFWPLVEQGTNCMNQSLRWYVCPVPDAGREEAERPVHQMAGRCRAVSEMRPELLITLWNERWSILKKHGRLNLWGFVAVPSFTFKPHRFNVHFADSKDQPNIYCNNQIMIYICIYIYIYIYLYIIWTIYMSNNGKYMALTFFTKRSHYLKIVDI